MKFTLKEMNGLLNGKCLPSDLLFGETLADYLIRKFDDTQQQLAESHRALRAETTAHENTQMQLEKMAAESVGLKESRQRLAEFIHEELDADYPLNMNIETPATDAFLAEVRAQGADECVRQLVISDDDDDFCDAPNVCAMVAHQLRKGVSHERNPVRRKRCRYVASDAGTFPEDAYFLDPRHIDELTSEWEFESLAQDAALDYFDNHDGWESSWPLDIELFVDGESVGVFAVEMEYVPRFSARKRTEAAQ